MRVAIPSAVVLLPVIAMSAGCGVQQGRYDNLVHTQHATEEQLVAANDERDAAVASAEQMNRDLAAARSQVRRLEDEKARLARDVESIASEYDQLLSRVSSLEIGPLPADVETALAELTRAYPQLLSFDAERGMIRFASDFTFALGSTDLQPEGAATLALLADILNQDNASNIEARIVGHTDNVPIGKPETRRNHPTNVHLSVHRAISVRDALTNAGIDPARVQVAGYGEFRPVVANGKRGAAANRRVEIFLMPMPHRSASAPLGRKPVREAVVVEETIEPMK